MIKIFNSMGRNLSTFEPVNKEMVGIYACGPTVYDYSHIGHGRKYVGDDVIKRSLKFLGYKVKHVMNITDVGHLVSDGDEGEDKLEKGAKKQGKTVWEVSEFFTEDFYKLLKDLNMDKVDVICKATDHIKEQIAQIEDLFKNGYAYDTPEAVYFDTAKFKDYGKLFGQNLDEKLVGVREEVRTDSNKKNPTDFVLWFKRVGHYKDHIMHWESPWGDGFPGWHIECSAMSTKYLGNKFDIHTGGVDHLSVHHPNEIAQAEGATGEKPFVKYWVHHEFLNVDGKKMSKSLGNFFRPTDLFEKGYDPMHLRYFYLTAHYRSKLNFTFEALDSSRNAYEKLVKMLSKMNQSEETVERGLDPDNKYQKLFIEAIEDDFNTPKMLAILWEVVKASDLTDEDKYENIIFFDRVLGLRLEENSKKFVEKEVEISPEIKNLIEQRNSARANKDWVEADRIRDLLKSKYNFDVTDLRS